MMIVRTHRFTSYTDHHRFVVVRCGKRFDLRRTHRFTIAGHEDTPTCPACLTREPAIGPTVEMCRYPPPLPHRPAGGAKSV
jgi:hypothetical protein